jgi:hypothetical protein
MSKQSLHSQDIIGLISKLKESTPEYPTDLLAARKAAFLQQAVAINIDGNGLSGKGGGDGGIGGTGGSGALGGMSTAQTILLQAVIGVWVVAAMLTAAYVFRDQIIDLLQDNGIVEMTQIPSGEFAVPATIVPATEIPTLEFTSTPIPTAPDDLPVIETAPDNSSDSQSTPESTKQNPGLHLGQTPGAPDTPNQNKPDKPDQSDKQK